MLSYNWRSYLCFFIAYNAFALSWVLPRVFCAQKESPASNPPRDVIEAELRIKLLEEQIREFLNADGNPESDEYRQMLQNLLREQKTVAEAGRKLAARQLAELKERLSQEIQVARDKTQEQVLRMQEQVGNLHTEKQRLTKALKATHRELERRVRVTMPPLEDTATRVFHLEHIDGHKLRDTIEEILGADLLRLSVGASPQTFVVRGGGEALARAEALIQKMDQASVVSRPEEPSELPRSLMVRIFWLSNGQAFSGAQGADEMLPESVIQALGQIGLEFPCVVLQSNTSISLGNDKDKAKFEVRDLPAIFFHERVLLDAKGEVYSTEGNQISLSIEASTERTVDGERIFESHVSGSIVAPLEHFVILGTANFASEDPDDGNDFNTGLAFVVQVIESESFAPEP